MSLHIKPDGFVTDEFADLIVKLANGYPTTGRPTTPQILWYARVLGDVTIDELKVAVVRASREGSSFFPSAPDLYRFARGTLDDAAVLAWTAFEHAAREVGAWASVEVEDERAAEALEFVFGSWPNFCHMDDGPALAVKRQEFIAAYKSPRVGRSAIEQTKVLVGICDRGESRFSGQPRNVAWRIESRRGLLQCRLAPTGALVAVGTTSPRSEDGR